MGGSSPPVAVRLSGRQAPRVRCRALRTLASAAERPLQWRLGAGLSLSFDDARILQMIEAAQCSDRCRLQEVAARLLTGEKLAECLRATQSLANALAARDCFATDC